MEESSVTLASLYPIILVVILFYFRGSIKAISGLTEKVITTTTETAEDSLSVYSSDIRATNAVQRGKILRKVEKAIDNKSFATQKTIDSILLELNEDDEDYEEPQVQAKPKRKPRQAA